MSATPQAPCPLANPRAKVPRIGQAGPPRAAQKRDWPSLYPSARARARLESGVSPDRRESDEKLKILKKYPPKALK
eukprot:6758200-Pyramimonas_sp.AAC.1